MENADGGFSVIPAQAGIQVCVPKVTGVARQGKIIEIIGAAARLRMDISTSKGKLKTLSGA
jgi:hypothetical protein